MSTHHIFWSRLRGAIQALFGSRRADDELRAELEAHYAMHVEENLRRGMSLDAAQREARLAGGGVTLAVEAAREQRGLPWVENISGDVRYALRGLRRKPAFTIAVVATLALGIGANTAMFTIVNAVVLRPLPYPDPDRIVSLSIREGAVDGGMVDDRNYYAWLNDARTVTIAADQSAKLLFTQSALPEEIRGQSVTAPYFAVVGASPLLGRVFAMKETLAGHAGVGDERIIILGEGLWRRRFGADSAIVGRIIALDGRPTRVIGVLPARFSVQNAEFWLPYHPREPGTKGDRFYYHVLARLKDSATLDAARRELTAISRRVANEGGGASGSTVNTPVVKTLHDRLYGDRRQPLLVLFAAVGVLLIVACANVAALTLARASGRARELAMRLALGASRWRVVRGLLCESILLAIAGGALGCVLARWSVAYLVRLSPTSVGQAPDIQVDWLVLAFTAAIAIVTGIVFGLVPAIVATRSDISATLTSGRRVNAGARRRRFGRPVLVIGQLATAVVLLTAAGLVAHTFLRLATTDLGFDPDRIITAKIELPAARHPEASVEPFYDNLLARLRSLPGVETAALAELPPLVSWKVMDYTTTDKRGHQSPDIELLPVGPQYFHAMGAQVRGREFVDDDRAGTTPVVVINQSFANYLAHEKGVKDVVGQTTPLFPRGETTIIGVVDDVRQHTLETGGGLVAYSPIAQYGLDRDQFVIVRTTDAVNNEQLRQVSAAVRSMDTTLSPQLSSMTVALATTLAPRRFTFLLLGAFAAIAALLAVVGLYGVLTQVVSDRTREIGIRVALGANAVRVTRLVMAQGLTLTVIGVAIGLGASAFTVRAVRSLVFGVSVYDPWSFAVSAGLLIAVAALASWIPARRASRVDPVIALRAE